MTTSYPGHYLCGKPEYHKACLHWSAHRYNYWWTTSPLIDIYQSCTSRFVGTWRRNFRCHVHDPYLGPRYGSCSLAEELFAKSLDFLRWLSSTHLLCLLAIYFVQNLNYYFDEFDRYLIWIMPASIFEFSRWTKRPGCGTFRSGYFHPWRGIQNPAPWLLAHSG